MLKILLQGFFIGMAKIIPGFSGSLLAITFGVYEKTLNIIANIRKLTKEKIIYLLLLGIGIIMGIVIFSYIVKCLLEIIYFPIMLLFIGLIIGSMRELGENVKEYSHPLLGLLFFVSSFIIVLLLSNNQINENDVADNIFLYFPLGLIESVTTLIPGISGTAIYMILGVYNLILDLYINIFNFNNLLNFLFYFLGFGFGCLILAKILTFILTNYRKLLYISILGFMLAAVIMLIKDAFSNSYNIIDYILGLFFLYSGYILSSKLNHLF